MTWRIYRLTLEDSLLSVLVCGHSLDEVRTSKHLVLTLGFNVFLLVLIYLTSLLHY